MVSTPETMFWQMDSKASSSRKLADEIKLFLDLLALGASDGAGTVHRAASPCQGGVSSSCAHGEDGGSGASNGCWSSLEETDVLPGLKGVGCPRTGGHMAAEAATQVLASTFLASRRGSAWLTLTSMTGGTFTSFLVAKP